MNTPSTVENTSASLDVHFRPLHDRLLVRRIAERPEPQKIGLLWVPGTAMDRSGNKPQGDNCEKAVVMAIGPKVREVEPGDTIYFGRYTDSESENGDLCVIQEGDVIAKVEESAA